MVALSRYLVRVVKWYHNCRSAWWLTSHLSSAVASMDSEPVCALQEQLRLAIGQIADLQLRIKALEEHKGPSSAENSSNPVMPYLDLHQAMQLGVRRISSVPSFERGSSNTAASRLKNATNGTLSGSYGAPDGCQASRLPSESSGQVPEPAVLHIPMAATRVVMTQLVSPAESTGLNICSGGTVLSWIDICAGLAAKTLARSPAVTASVDAVHFLRPCHVGSVVTIAAMVNRTFTSSMEVGVRVEEECVSTGARHHCCRYLACTCMTRSMCCVPATDANCAILFILLLKNSIPAALRRHHLQRLSHVCGGWAEGP